MEKILLVSANFIKNISNISDNISGKLIEPAIWEAQNEGLRGILGDALVNRLEELVATDEINLEANVMYKTLLNKCQYFLAYTAISNICMLTAVKIDNAGLEQVSDEKMDPLDMDDSFRLQGFYQKKADYLCHQLQNFVLNNRAAYPELRDCDCMSIKAHLYSAATPGLWLGGIRGRRLHRVCDTCRCRRYRR